MEEILAELQPIFRDIFDDEGLVITKDSSAETIEDWDSLSHVRLIMAVGKHFGIKFGFGELKDLKNVGDMCELIANKLSEKK